MLNLIFRVVLLQVGSNGFLHSYNNHFSDVQVHKARTPNKFQDLKKKCIFDDFSDEQVRIKNDPL